MPHMMTVLPLQHQGIFIDMFRTDKEIPQCLPLVQIKDGIGNRAHAFYTQLYKDRLHGFSFEESFDFFKETPSHWMGIMTTYFCKLFEQIFLPGIEARGCFDLDSDMLITDTITL